MNTANQPIITTITIIIVTMEIQSVIRKNAISVGHPVIVNIGKQTLTTTTILEIQSVIQKKAILVGHPVIITIIIMATMAIQSVIQNKVIIVEHPVVLVKIKILLILWIKF